MATFAGDLIEVRWSHPTLGSGVFYPKSGEDSTLELGGFRNSDDANMNSGNGERIYQKNRVSPFFECVVANDTITNLEAETAVALAQSSVEAIWEVSHSNGSSYKLRGLPSGDIQPNLNQGTFTLKVVGSGKAEKIV
jgi:hypothetical protein